jgi:hypothetical protein
MVRCWAVEHQGTWNSVRLAFFLLFMISSFVLLTTLPGLRPPPYRLSNCCWWSGLPLLCRQQTWWCWGRVWSRSCGWTGSTGGDYAHTPEGPQCWGSAWQTCCCLPLPPGSGRLPKKVYSSRVIKLVMSFVGTIVLDNNVWITLGVSVSNNLIHAFNCISLLYSNIFVIQFYSFPLMLHESIQLWLRKQCMWWAIRSDGPRNV